MIVKAKYDNVEYADQGIPYIVFKAGCTYIALEKEDHRYTVNDARGRQLLFCQRAFNGMFEIIKEELK